MSLWICVLELWIIHVTALNILLPCFAHDLEEIGTPAGIEPLPISRMHYVQIGVDTGVWASTEDEFLSGIAKRRYFYAHNETQIAMARAEAEGYLRSGGGGSGSTLSSIFGSATSFPDSSVEEDGCHFNSLSGDLSFHGSDGMWDLLGSVEAIEILAVDSCTRNRNVPIGDRYFELSSQRWVKPEIPVRANPVPLTRSFKMFVKINVVAMEIFAEGVYFPASGTMHLVGCAREDPLSGLPSVYANSTPTVVMSDDVLDHVEAETESVLPSAQLLWSNLEMHHEPPLNSSAAYDCAISATVQYPPLNCRWNKDRVVKYSFRSNRAKDDPLYFGPPIEGRAFVPYLQRYFRDYNDSENLLLWQRRLETGGQVSLLMLGLLCIARQIDHSSKNEESLPFVSLVMLGIQLAHHLSQTTMFKDLQIHKFHYNRQHFVNSTGHWQYRDDFHFPNSISDLHYKYYETMAWSEYAPYQALAMTAIFMYVWLFHKVGDRRRIMKLRVLRRRPGATDPPSDWRVMHLTLAIFSIVGFLGCFIIGADQYVGYFRRALAGIPVEEEPVNQHFHNPSNLTNLLNEDLVTSPFVSSRLFELSQAQWGFVNKMTSLVVSFFLVPQLLGNSQWRLQLAAGRPLSAWFYVGIPTLNLLPHAFSVATHFQLLPIFPGVYDPYMNSLYGFFLDPTPWWQILVIVCSSFQVPGMSRPRANCTLEKRNRLGSSNVFI
ncbi:hypothetical protein M758_6G138000 [Ceratodon purpureus]|nr:hypothetical protein M758_6G138000 [Ceratodon purpureus]